MLKNTKTHEFIGMIYVSGNSHSGDCLTVACMTVAFMFNPKAERVAHIDLSAFFKHNLPGNFCAVVKLQTDPQNEFISHLYRIVF